MRYTLLFLFLICSTLQAQVGFTQTGKASFYNDRFHGAKTKSGEKYDMNAYTAAHRELPHNTKVKVTNLKNNKTVIVRINDIGPFHHVRILDVSKAAAKELDMISQGVANVKIEVVEMPNEPVKDTKSAGTPTSPVKENKAVAADAMIIPAKTEKNEVKGAESETPSKVASSESNSPAKIIAGAETMIPEVEAPKVDLKEASSEIFKEGYIYNVNGMIQNPKGYGLQVGYFSHIFNTLRFCKMLSENGFTKLFIKADKETFGTVYRVFIGDYAKEDDAYPDIVKLREKNRDYLIKKYPENKDLP